MATISYSFAIADVNPLPDPPWTALYSGNWKVVSNQGTAANFGGRQGNKWNADSFGNDQEAFFTIGTGSGTWCYESWVACRLNGSGEGYVVYFGQGFSTINIGTIGSVGNITNLQNTGATGSVGDVIGIRVVGTTIKALKNGAQVGSDETSALYTSGAIGFGGTFVGFDVITLFEGGDYPPVVGGQPTMRRWGGVPAMGGFGIGNKGTGRMWGRRKSGIVVPARFTEAA